MEALARAAATHLLPNLPDDASFACPGGASKTVFNVADEYAVRVLRSNADSDAPHADAQLARHTQAVSALGLTPEFVAADEHAVVQRWASGVASMPDQWAHDVDMCRRLGVVCAALHGIALTDAEQRSERSKARPADLRAFIAKSRTSLDAAAKAVLDSALQVVDALDVALKDVPRDRLVWTHGDLHYDNVVLRATDNQLLVLDFELAGARPAATDLAYLFFTAGLKDPSAAPLKEGRRAFAAAYLGDDAQPADIDRLLWSLELETVPQSLWMYLCIMPLFPWSDQVAAWMSGAMALANRAVTLLTNATADDSVRQNIIDNGLLRVAAASV